MNKEELFRKLVKNNEEREAYFESLPRDICMAFIDNGYCNNLLHERDMLIDNVFGEHAAAISWFLYEWKPGYDVGINGRMFKIYNIDEYILYMKLNEGFE